MTDTSDTTSPTPPLDWVRLSTRAAELITALAHPDLAGLLAVMPRRPGTAIDADELRTRSGLELKPFAAAVSRGRNAGVLAAPAPGRLAVDTEAIEAVVTGLAALAPLGHLVAARPDLARFARFGRLAEIPIDPAPRAELFAVAADLLPPDRDLTESEVNQHLLLASDDPATLRRELFDAGLLDRSADGSAYRRTLIITRGVIAGRRDR